MTAPRVADRSRGVTTSDRSPVRPPTSPRVRALPPGVDHAAIDRARAAEACGFDSLWLYDHLYSPGQPDQPSLEGWTLATYLLARTERLRVGHLVLCNNFRHPALLATMASTLDVLSDGRLELGIGSGSVAAEHEEAGLPWGSAADRSERLGESLEIITRMFEGAPTTFTGTHYQVRGLPNLPRPVQRPQPPIHVGGIGPRRTLPLVARYADVWNIPTYGLERWEESARILDAGCEAIGRAPATVGRSLEAVLVLVPDQSALDAERARAGAALRRPRMGPRGRWVRRHPGHGVGPHRRPGRQGASPPSCSSPTTGPTGHPRAVRRSRDARVRMTPDAGA